MIVLSRSAQHSHCARPRLRNVHRNSGNLTRGNDLMKLLVMSVAIACKAFTFSESATIHENTAVSRKQSSVTSASSRKLEVRGASSQLPDERCRRIHERSNSFHRISVPPAAFEKDRNDLQTSRQRAGFLSAIGKHPDKVFPGRLLCGPALFNGI
jgi:hypothetical protein